MDRLSVRLHRADLEPVGIDVSLRCSGSSPRRAEQGPVSIVSRSTAGPAHVPGELDVAIHQLGVIPVASVLSGLLTQTIGIPWLIAISAAGLLATFVILPRFSEIRKV